MKLVLKLLSSQGKNFLNAKVLIISGRLVVVEMIHGFKSKVLVILIKCSLQTSNSPQSSETMQPFSEIIILLENRRQGRI